MKNIATYGLMAGTMMGLLPKNVLANHSVQPVMGMDLKMGNGTPEFATVPLLVRAAPLSMC
jgi:hypothetical protein